MSYPQREGMTLTPEAEHDYMEWSKEFGDDSCRCCISPPCFSCTHPGNPMNIEEDDDAWQARAALAEYYRQRGDTP